MSGENKRLIETGSDSELAESGSHQNRGFHFTGSSHISIPDPDTWIAKMQTFFLSRKFHAIIIALVVLDCLCVTGKLIITSLHKEMINSIGRNSASTTVPNLNRADSFNCSCLPANQTFVNIVPMNPDMYLAHRVFKYTSFVILSVFVLEIVLRFIFVPKVFAHFLELFDTIVILVSFAISLYVIVDLNDVYSFTGIVTIIRFVFK
jgi:hypothetical protein